VRATASVIQRFVALSPLLLSCGGVVSTSTSAPDASNTSPPDTSNFASSDALVIDATSLYWIDGRGVIKAPRAGGSAQTLTTSASGYFIRVNATDLFWIDLTAVQIKRVSIGGGPSAMAAAQVCVNCGIAVDGEHLYFTAQGLVEMTLGTGVTRTLTETYALGLALDGDQIFGTSCAADHVDNVWRVPKAGGQRVALVHDAYCPITIATRGNYVYYWDYVDVSTPSAGFALWRAPRDGGTKEELALIDNQQFAVDATSAYAFQSGALVRIPLDKSPTTQLAKVAGGVGIAVDDARVYWIHGDASGPLVLESATK
jgi:hypothetical protein